MGYYIRKYRKLLFIYLSVLGLGVGCLTAITSYAANCASGVSKCSKGHCGCSGPSCKGNCKGDTCDGCGCSCYPACEITESSKCTDECSVCGEKGSVHNEGSNHDCTCGDCDASMCVMEPDSDADHEIDGLEGRSCINCGRVETPGEEAGDKMKGMSPEESEEFMTGLVASAMNNNPDAVSDLLKAYSDYLATTDPINIVSGEIYFTEDDLLLMCPGLNISFSRYYASDKGWRNSYEWKLESFVPKGEYEYISSGGYSKLEYFDEAFSVGYDVSYSEVWAPWMPKKSELMLTTGDGVSYKFTDGDGSGVFHPEAMDWSIERNSYGIYTLHQPGGLKRIFENDRLTHIQDGWGNRIDLTYGTNQVEITHSNGKTLVLQHGGDESKPSVAYVSDDLYVLYDYDSNGFLTNTTRYVEGELYEISYQYDQYGMMTNKVDSRQDEFKFGYEFAPGTTRPSLAQNSFVTEVYGSLILRGSTALGGSTTLADGSILGGTTILRGFSSLASGSTLAGNTVFSSNTVFRGNSTLGGSLELPPQTYLGVGTYIEAGSTYEGAVVQTSFTLSSDTLLTSNAVLLADSEIGEGTTLVQDAAIPAGTVLGGNILMHDGCQLGSGSSLGTGTRLGTGTLLSDGTIVADGSSLGAGTILGEGTRIGAGSVIGGYSRLGRGSEFLSGGSVVDLAYSPGVSKTIGADMELKGTSSWSGGKLFAETYDTLEKGNYIETDEHYNRISTLEIGDGWLKQQVDVNWGYGFNADEYGSTSTNWRISEVTYDYGNGDLRKSMYKISGDGLIDLMVGPYTGEVSEVRGTRFTYDDKSVTKQVMFDEEVGEALISHNKYDHLNRVTGSGVYFDEAYDSEAETLPPVWSVEYAYDDITGFPSAMTNAEGHWVEMTYTNGSLLAQKAFYSDSQSYDTVMDYYTNGLLKTVTNPNNHATTCKYDENGFLITKAQELGPTVSNTFNSLGFVTRSEILAEDGTPTGVVTEFDVDAEGKVHSVTDAEDLVTYFAYDKGGCVTNTQDRVGRITEYAYGPVAKLTSVTRYLEQGGSNVPVRISYDFDKQLNALRITEPRNRYVESYQMDLQNRVVAVTNIENQVMSLNYGVGSFVKGITRYDNTTISNSYDTAGRPSAVTYGDSNGVETAVITFNYYADSVLKSVADGASSISNQYDRLNRVTNVIQSASAVTSMANYGYDPAGNLTNSVVSLNGQSSEIKSAYSYDAAERLKTINSDAGDFEFEYNPSNGKHASYSNSVSGITCSYGYDIMGRVTNIVYSKSDGSVIRALEYGYDKASMITNKTVIGGVGTQLNQSKEYRYDSLNRLVGESYSGNMWLSYEYDLAGNRTKFIYGADQSDHRCVDGDANNYCDSCGIYYSEWESGYGIGNRLTNWFDLGAVQYDVAGNTTNLIDGAGNQWKLGWDERYRMTSVTSSTEIVSYTYNVLGRKTSRKVTPVSVGPATEEEYYIYNGEHIVADVDASGNLLRSYTYGPGIDNILSMTVYGSTETNTYHYLKDHQHTVIALTDDSGNVVESYDYDAWSYVQYAYDANGNTISESEIGNRYLFQGREYDWNTGFYYFRARWYNPETGRWLSKDPKGIAGGLNLYAFCKNNPVCRVDPLGLCDEVSKLISMIAVSPWGQSDGKEVVDNLRALHEIGNIRIGQQFGPGTGPVLYGDEGGIYDEGTRRILISDDASFFEQVAYLAHEGFHHTDHINGDGLTGDGYSFSDERGAYDAGHAVGKYLGVDSQSVSDPWIMRNYRTQFDHRRYE